MNTLAMNLLLVCLGGALGSVTRYLVSLATPRGTLVVNLVGSFFIALLMALMRPSDVRLVLVTGFLGGFTTYSAFNEETLRLLRAGSVGAAAGYVLLTVFGCLAAGYVGLVVSRVLIR
jgi:Integral membrane protein possibly involved in chromosome condensation